MFGGLVMEGFLTPKQVSKMTGYSIGFLSNQRGKKEGFPFYKFGRKVYYKQSEVLSVIESTRVATTNQIDHNAS